MGLGVPPLLTYNRGIGDMDLFGWCPLTWELLAAVGLVVIEV